MNAASEIYKNKIKPRRKGSTKLWVMLYLMLCVGSLSIGFALGYIYEPSPQKVLGRMVDEMAKVKSYRYQGEVKVIDMTVKLLRPSSILKADFIGQMEIGNLDISKNELKISLPKQGRQFSFGKLSLPMNIYLKLVDAKLYFSIEAVGSNKNLTAYKNIEDKWAFLDIRDSVSEYYSVEVSTLLEDLMAIEEEKQQEVIAVFRENLPINVIEKLPSKTISEKPVYGYKWEFDHEKYKTLILQLATTLTPMLDELAESLDDISITGELWVGKQDYLPYQISVDIKLTEESKFLEIEIEIDYTFSDYNQPVEIKAPTENLIPAQDYSSYSRNSYGEVEDVNARIIADLEQLRMSIALYYNANSSSYDGVEQCLTNPTATTCKEDNISRSISALIQDIAETIKEKPSFSVSANTTEYCMSNKLKDSTNYVCVDSNGSTITTEVQDPCGGNATICPQ